MDEPTPEIDAPVRATHGRAAALVLVFVVSCTATWFGVRASATPDPAFVGREGLTEKARYLRNDPEPFDVYFVGASAVYRSFDPAVLDPALAAAGCPVRTYNLALGGADPIETKTLIDIALRDNPDATVVVGPTLPPRFELDIGFDLKGASFYDIDDLDDAVALAADASFGDQARAATIVVASQVPVGHLHYRLYPERVRDLAPNAVLVQDALTGYTALEAELDQPEIRNRRDRALDRIAEVGHEAWLADLHRVDVGVDLTIGVLEQLIDHVGDRAPVITTLPPIPFVDDMAQIDERWRAKGRTPLLALYDPGAFPILALHETWFDEGHLTAPAAASMSVAAAAPLCELLRGIEG